MTTYYYIKFRSILLKDDQGQAYVFWLRHPERGWQEDTEGLLATFHKGQDPFEEVEAVNYCVGCADMEDPLVEVTEEEAEQIIARGR